MEILTFGALNSFDEFDVFDSWRILILTHLMLHLDLLCQAWGVWCFDVIEVLDKCKDDAFDTLNELQWFDEVDALALDIRTALDRFYAFDPLERL